MGVQERREREKAELRQVIMDAARKIFVEEGYENVSMRRIADAIEYSPTAIYVHFKDKADLFAAIMRRDFDHLAARFARTAAIADPIDRIRALGLEYVRFGVENPQHYRLMFMTPTVLHDPAMKAHATESLKRRGDPTHDSYALLRSAVEQGLSDGRFHGEFADAELLSQTLWAGVHGVVSLEITMRHDPWMDWRPVRRRAAAMVDALLRGTLRGVPGGPSRASSAATGPGRAAPKVKP